MKDRNELRGTATTDGDAAVFVAGTSGVDRIGPLPDPNVLGATEGGSSGSIASGLYGWTVPLLAGAHRVSCIGTVPGHGSSDGDPFPYRLAVVDTITAS